MTFVGMVKAGGRALGRLPGLLAALYAVQLLFALATMAAIASTLAAIYGPHELFDRAVAGDAVALVVALRGHEDVAFGLVWLAIFAAALYGVVSWFLVAGLLGALREPPGTSAREVARAFGAAGATRFFAFARLWAWSVLPYAVALVALLIGLDAGADAAEEALTMRAYVLPPLLGALPGGVLFALTACAVDYARALLVAEPARRGAGHALLAGYALVLRRPRALAHYALYLAIWGGVTAAYVAATFGHPFAGAGGALALFGLRQLVAVVRFAARVATIAGQLALVERDAR